MIKKTVTPLELFIYCIIKCAVRPL
jgi:hypothetical protein